MYLSRDGKVVIECTKCHVHTFAWFYKDRRLEDIRKSLIEFWNNDENWEPKRKDDSRITPTVLTG